MWNEILQMAIQNGIWAVLFLGLLVFELKDSNNREKKYQKTICELTNSLGVLNEIKGDVIDIKNSILTKRKKKNEI